MSTQPHTKSTLRFPTRTASLKAWDFMLRVATIDGPDKIRSELMPQVKAAAPFGSNGQWDLQFENLTDVKIMNAMAPSIVCSLCTVFQKLLTPSLTPPTPSDQTMQQRERSEKELRHGRESMSSQEVTESCERTATSGKQALEGTMAGVDF
ncbi:hypothetical protein FBULB1_3907 [Fusarium bulbicola]|nr:hypothetical protein FBULB1_3907 [Fusarium bulbicola]